MTRIKKFICEVERVDKYIVEIDETKFNEEEMERFRQDFYDFHTYEEHAKHLAQLKARFTLDFIEGYGVVLVDGIPPYGNNDSQVNDAINIKIIEEDENCNVSVMEIYE